jgi:altronate hydrolase
MTLKVHPEDNVIVALEDLPAGTAIELEDQSLVLQEDVPLKHKFNQTDLKAGDDVIMYGVLVGKATRHIPRGSHITRDNVVHDSHDYQVGERKTDWEIPDTSRFANRTFQGYHRANGLVGTRNYWLVVPLVFCENRNLKVIEETMLEALGYHRKKRFALDINELIDRYQAGDGAEAILEAHIARSPEELRQRRVFPHVDGIKFLRHQGGCGGTRQDSEMLCRLLAGYITHPNVAGATVLSLGCQNAQIEDLQRALQEKDPHFAKPVYLLEQQKSKSEPDFIAEAVKKTFVGLMQANEISRQPAPLSALKLGLECGGSDGFSGLSANPALGYASDLLVALEGTAILSEFPELNGVEQELINRCTTDETAKKFAQLMRSYSKAAQAVGVRF